MPRPRPGLLTRTLLVALAIAAFVTTSGVVRSALPWPSARGVAAKRAWWEAHKDEVDVVLLGSSRVARGYIPEVVEQQLAEAGHDLTVFNFGIIGMAAYESDHVLRWILSTRPARLKWVLLEPESWRPDMPDPDKPLTPRDVYWRSARLTWQGMRAVSLSKGPWDVQYASYVEHLERFGMRETNAGAGRWLLEQTLSDTADPDDPTLSEVDLHRGWQPHGAPHDEGFLKAIRIHERRGAESPYGRMLEAIRACRDRTSDVLLGFFDVASVDDQFAAVRAAGATPVPVIGPSTREKPWIAALARTGHLPMLIDYQDPDRYPQLYDIHMHYDADHLNEEGARELSRLLGTDLAATIDRVEGGELR